MRRRAFFHFVTFASMAAVAGCGARSALRSEDATSGAGGSVESTSSSATTDSNTGGVGGATSTGGATSMGGTGGTTSTGGVGGCGGSVVWVRRFGDVASDYGNAVAMDGMGNVVVVGDYVGHVDFGGGELPYASTFSTFVVKLDGDGNHVWSRGFANDYGAAGMSVAIDGAGNVAIAGEFRGTIDFGGGVLTNEDTGIPDPYVVKLSAEGEHLWSNAYSGDESDVANGVAFAAQGDVLVVGHYGVGNGGSIDLGGGSMTAMGSGAAFVLKLSAGGEYLWSKSFDAQSLSYDSVNGIAANADGSFLLAGQSDGPIDFGGGVLPKGGNADAFVVMLDPTGEHVWSRALGGPGSDRAIAVASAVDGGALVTGVFNESIDLGGGTLSSKGAEDIFVGRFDAAGDHVWSRAFGGPGNDEGRAAAMDLSGDAIVAGPHGKGVDFGGGELPWGGNLDIFALKLDKTGSYSGHQSFGSEAYDTTWSVAVWAQGDVVLAGSFSKTVAFGSCVLESAGATDIVVARLKL